MDKLKAALVYKFWMLLAVALLVPMIGWWMATSAISAQVGDRMTKIDGAFNSLTSSGENPNEKWSTQIKRQMSVQELAVQQGHQNLFEGQKVLLTWPAGLSWSSETIPTEAQITQKDIDYYRNLYDDLIQKVHEIPSPIDVATGTGLVNFPFERLPHEDFSSFPPTRQQIVETREDMWLYSTLLTAIANVNQLVDAKTQLEAPIRQISKIELRGGRSRGPSGLGGEAGAGGGASAIGGASGGMGMPAATSSGGGHGDGGGKMMGMMASAGGLGGGTAGMGGGAGGGQTNVEFDAAEDFGSAGDGGGGGGMSAMPSAAGGVASSPAGGHGGTAGGGVGGGSSGKSRYLEENTKYKLRGFYMSLTMDHRHLPELLVELSNSAWPIRVMRVQQADLLMQDLAAAVAGGPGGGALGMPAAAGGGVFGASPMGRPLGGAAAPMGGEAGGAGIGVSAGGSISALDDPFLVQIAVCGFFTIYKPPVTPQSAGTVPGGASPVTPTAPPADTGASLPLVGTAGNSEAATGAVTNPTAPGTADKSTSASPPSESAGDASKPNPPPTDEGKKGGTSPPAETTGNSPAKPKPDDAKPSDKSEEKGEKSPEEK